MSHTYYALTAAQCVTALEYPRWRRALADACIVEHAGTRYALVDTADVPTPPVSLPTVTQAEAWARMATGDTIDDVDEVLRALRLLYRRAAALEPVPDRYVVLTVTQAAALPLRLLRDVWEHVEAVEVSERLYLLVPVSGDLSSIDGGWGLPAGLDVSGRQTRTLAYVEGWLEQYDGPTRRAWRQALRDAIEAER